MPDGENFELHPERRCLLRSGEPVPIGSRAFDVLLALAQRRDRIVTKAELLDLAWPGLVVEENNLPVQIGSLRKVLGPQAIATIPGRGYRLTAAIKLDANGSSSATTEGLPDPTQPQRPRTAFRTNLPEQLAPLYGREAELQALQALVDANRLVTIVGTGGIGKSRLAQALAHRLAARWPGGAWMVELAGLSDPSRLPNVIAQALEIRVSGQDSALQELLMSMAANPRLLVLDNCEHLLDAVAALVQAVLHSARKVSILATSQAPLHVLAEQQYRVAPLAVPDDVAAAGPLGFGALALFEARVRAADPRFSTDADGWATAIEICSRLDGLPLAIELAAARVATLGLGPVRDKLDARLQLLVAGSRSSPLRHQTLRAALEWSYGLLSEAERGMFRKLAIFAGGFTMETAQAVCGDAQLDEWAVMDHLSALIDKSLVVADEGFAPRYRMLETAKAFALEQLSPDAMAELRKRHVSAICNFFERVDCANLDGELRTDQLYALLLPELDNLRVAYGNAMGKSRDLRSAVVLAACSSSLEDFAFECAEWLIPLRQHVEPSDLEPAVTARYWRALASQNICGLTALSLQIEAADRASCLYHGLGQSRREYSSRVQLGTYHLLNGDSVAAQCAADQARALLRPNWPGMLRVRLLRLDAQLAGEDGRFDESLEIHHDVVRVSIATGDWLLEVMARVRLYRLLWQSGQTETAAREMLGVAEELRKRPLANDDMAWAFAFLIGMLSELGRTDEASSVALEALPTMRRNAKFSLSVWAHLFWRRGQLGTAAFLLRACDAETAKTELPLSVSEKRLVDATREALSGRMTPAALSGAQAAGVRLDEAEIFARISDGLARTAGGRHDIGLA